MVLVESDGDRTLHCDGGGAAGVIICSCEESLIAITNIRGLSARGNHPHPTVKKKRGFSGRIFFSRSNASLGLTLRPCVRPQIPGEKS